MSRFRSVEVLLRVLAFSQELDTYDGNLAKFLNNFMYARLHINDFELEATELNLSTYVQIALDRFYHFFGLANTLSYLY